MKLTCHLIGQSDPTLNLQSPVHDEPPTPPPAVSLAPSTEAEEPTSPPLDQDSPADDDSGPNLPPPPELSELDDAPPGADSEAGAEDQAAGTPDDLPADAGPIQAANTDEELPSPDAGESSDNPADLTQPSPVDELNPLPDPNLEQQKDDGSSNIPDLNSDAKPADTAEQPAGEVHHRTLILYAYSESDSARANIQFFITKGLHSTSDFIFIINGNNSVASLIPSLPNVRIISRENTCYDLGAFGEVLRQDDLYKQYTRFITLNASIRGPFLPMWTSKQCWKDIYLSRVTDETKLVGMTLNCKPRPHIQSMILATDQIGIAAMLDPKQALAASVDDQFANNTNLVAFAGCYAGYKEAVHAEIGTTGLIQAAGYKVDVLMTAMHSESTPEEFCKANPDSGDVLFNGAYFGSNVHPYETVFIKANRNVDTKLLDKMTEWHLKMAETSFDTCV
ncbi:hypothetical protein V8F06_008525 [Rhypophila decipiens]